MGETHLRNLLGLSGVRVVVVADPRLEAAERGKPLAGAVGKVVVEAPQKTPLVFAKDFGSSFDHFENFPDRFELESFFVALREGRKPSPGPEDALETLRLALAAKKSWRENRPVKVSEIQA